MKTIFTLVACSLLLVIAGCKSETNTVTGTTFTPEMSATVDGTSWTAIAPQVISQGGITVMSGVNVEGRVISISLNGISATGTYPLGGLLNQRVGTLTLGTTPADIYTTPILTLADSTSGSLVVTTYSGGQMQGTFSFRATNTAGASKSVASGKFNLKY
ncbi:MAG: hypothetical protein JNL32_02235 [Candidatus Kapabacteria bacterium]|nr:hypothetical protein [Candidatus Kapabacteria bacterium]